VTALETEPVPAVRGRTLTDRYLAAFPLATTYLWLLVLYGWQTRRHPTPWVFLDEIKFTRIARGIAEHLHPVVMGETSGFASLATVLMAPAWLFGSVGEGYALAKWIGVACMAATLFPAYGLARMVVGRWAALLAATGAVVAPCLAYTLFLVEEPYAYPFATLCLFLIVKALVTQRRRWVAGAIVASLVAPLVRNQLLVLPAVFAIAAFVLWWQTQRVRRWRATWSRWDYAGLVILGLGAWILFNALLGAHDKAWHDTTGYEKRWLFLHAIDAFGALTIGLGVFPVVAAAVALSPGKGWLTRVEERVLATVTASAVFCFVFYAGVKGAYLRANFGDIVVERNVIYLTPLLFVGLALFVVRPRFNPWAMGVTALVGLYLLLHTPTLMEKHYAYDTTGVEILQALNRWFALTGGGARVLLVVLLLVSLQAVLLVRTARPAIAQPVIAGLAVLTLAWCLTGEIAFGNAATANAQAIVDNMDTPRGWIDGLVGGKPVIFLGTGLTSPTTSAPSDTLYEAEFWNRSIVRQWSLDGSAPPPTLTPNVDARGHLLDSHYKEVAPNIDYYATTGDIDLDGQELAGPEAAFSSVTGYKLWRVRHPVTLAHVTRGLTGDSWAPAIDGHHPATASYSQYATPGYRDGYLYVNFSRSAACPKGLPAEHAVIRVGTLVVDKDNNPVIGKLLRTVRVTLPACADISKYVLTKFKPPFQATVSITPPFRLHDYDPRSGETRWLSAQVAFGFEGIDPTG
jgi:hypothetical protein